jgi:hypothetical protein
MANSKISALTSATTPLAGTETLPVVQSGATTQVSVANLTAGRAISTAGVTLTSGNLSLSGAAQVITGDFGSGTTSNRVAFQTNIVNGDTRVSIIPNGTGTLAGVVLYTDPARAAGPFVLIEQRATETRFNSTANLAVDYKPFNFWSGGAQRLQLTVAGDVSVTTGNIIPNTAAKGINFTANTPAAGMTSQLLNWYEEGTWTPAQGGGLTVVGAFSSTGKYIRFGSEVRVSGTVTGATSVAVTAAGVITTNLPFTVGTAGHGNVTNAALTSFAAVICTSTNITSAGAIAATGTLTFSATYFV